MPTYAVEVISNELPGKTSRLLHVCPRPQGLIPPSRSIYFYQSPRDLKYMSMLPKTYLITAISTPFLPYHAGPLGRLLNICLPWKCYRAARLPYVPCWTAATYIPTSYPHLLAPLFLSAPHQASYPTLLEEIRERWRRHISHRFKGDDDDAGLGDQKRT